MKAYRPATVVFLAAATAKLQESYISLEEFSQAVSEVTNSFINKALEVFQPVFDTIHQNCPECFDSYGKLKENWLEIWEKNNRYVYRCKKG